MGRRSAPNQPHTPHSAGWQSFLPRLSPVPLALPPQCHRQGPSSGRWSKTSFRGESVVGRRDARQRKAHKSGGGQGAPFPLHAIGSKPLYCPRLSCFCSRRVGIETADRGVPLLAAELSTTTAWFMKRAFDFHQGGGGAEGESAGALRAG